MASVSVPDLRYTDAEAALSVGFAGNFDQATQPGTGDLADGDWAFWWDSANSMMWLLKRRGAIIYCVELT